MLSRRFRSGAVARGHRQKNDRRDGEHEDGKADVRHHGNASLGVLHQVANALDLTVADLVGGATVRFDLDEAEIPASLRAFADDANLTSAEIRTLASIRWRRGDEPRTPERWRFIFDSLRLSSTIDGDDDAEQ